VEIRRENEDQGYLTLVQEVREADFAVQLPMRGGVEVPLWPGEEVQVYVPTSRGRYVFSTKVLERYYDRVPLCRLAKPREVTRLQRREYVRWQVALEVRYQVTDDPATPPPRARLRQRGLTVDLSGGGLQLLVREPVSVGSWLWLEFEIPYRGGQESVRALGKVRRVLPQEGEGPPRYLLGISFERIGDREREMIIAYIFHRMVSDRALVPPEE
jgi:c-di-GMP-binding flagellar brake protein YcgR